MSKVYGYVTDKIIAKLERGTIPWRKGYDCVGVPMNLISGRHYTGVNPWLLDMEEKESPYWLTFKQAKGLGGTIRKGSKSAMIVFYSVIEKKLSADKIDKYAMLRYYRVFNALDIDGIEIPSQADRINDPIQACQEVIDNLPEPGIAIEHSGNQPCYMPSKDVVQLPPINQFHNSTEYYSTLFHELIHSTGHKSRLDRFKKDSSGGLSNYAKEELVAELGSAFLCWQTGISNDSLIENESAYIENWLKALKNDKTLIVKASSQASKASDYLLNRSRVEAVTA